MDERLGIDPLDSFDRVVYARRGGYCYQLNGALSELLAALGYDVTRHVGGVHGPEGPDESALTNHLVLVAHELPDRDQSRRRLVRGRRARRRPARSAPVGRPANTSRIRCVSCWPAPTTASATGTSRHDPTGCVHGMSFRLPEVGMDVFAVRHEFLSTSPESSFAGVVTAQLRRRDGTTILRGCVLTRGRRRRLDERDGRRTRRRGSPCSTTCSASGPTHRPTALDALWARVAAAHAAWSPPAPVDVRAAPDVSRSATGRASVVLTDCADGDAGSALARLLRRHRRHARGVPRDARRPSGLARRRERDVGGRAARDR